MWTSLVTYWYFSVDGGNHDGESGSDPRRSKEKHPMPVPCTPTKPCSSASQSCLQVEGFCEKPGDQSNDDNLCKIPSRHAQGMYMTLYM